MMGVANSHNETSPMADSAAPNRGRRRINSEPSNANSSGLAGGSNKVRSTDFTMKYMDFPRNPRILVTVARHDTPNAAGPRADHRLSETASEWRPRTDRTKSKAWLPQI